ncbi:MAG TPA: PDZ domain-containing protein [Vicinamibacterales bacterium]
MTPQARSEEARDRLFDRDLGFEIQRQLDEGLRAVARSPRLGHFEWAPGAGRLGIVAQELTPQLTEFFGSGGVLVATVNPNTAASRSGLKAGDIISSVNGQAVRTTDNLVDRLRDVPNGQEATLEIYRDKKALTIKVMLAERTELGEV